MQCTLWSGLTKDVIVGLATGVFASAMYEYLVARRKSRRLKDRFDFLTGTYNEYARGSRSQLTSGGTITLEYCGDTKFTTAGINSKGEREWQGEIFMRQDAGALGEGFYSYLGKDDAGFHKVMYNPELKQFDVSGENTSDPEGVKDFKMIWKRRQ